MKKSARKKRGRNKRDPNEGRVVVQAETMVTSSEVVGAFKFVRKTRKRGQRWHVIYSHTTISGITMELKENTLRLYRK